MRKEASHTLWSTPDRARYFLIPDDRELPPGELRLITLTGRRQEVDLAAAAEFEVSREEAKARTQAALKEVLGEVRGKIQAWEEKAAAPETQEAQKTAAETLESLAAGLEQASATAAEKLRAAARNLRRDPGGGDA